MGISVKVSTKKVIAAMEQKIAANTKKIGEYEKAKEKYEMATEKHKKFVQDNAPKIAKSSGAIPEISVSNARSWGPNAGKVQVELTYYLNKEDAESLKFPEFEFDNNDCSVIQMREENKELGNAVRLLQMTDEEYVNTSTYKHVAKYL
jgi:hypothetical protein